jgi:hypothetical protein
MKKTPATNRPDSRNGLGFLSPRWQQQPIQADDQELVQSRRRDESFAIGAHFTPWLGWPIRGCQGACKT